jgi:hypothetical protein
LANFLQWRVFFLSALAAAGMALAGCAKQTATTEGAQGEIAGAPGAPATQDASATPGDQIVMADSPETIDWSARPVLIAIPVTLTRIDFETPLAEAVRRALAAQPGLRLTLLAVAPKLNAPEAQQKVDEIAQASANEVIAALTRLGIGPQRVQAFAIKDERAATPELRLYSQ